MTSSAAPEPSSSVRSPPVRAEPAQEPAEPDPQAIATAVEACRSVSRLSGGIAGEAASYLPGKRVNGVRVRPGGVAVTWWPTGTGRQSRSPPRSAPPSGRRLPRRLRLGASTSPSTTWTSRCSSPSGSGLSSPSRNSRRMPWQPHPPLPSRRYRNRYPGSRPLRCPPGCEPRGRGGGKAEPAGLTAAPSRACPYAVRRWAPPRPPAVTRRSSPGLPADPRVSAPPGIHTRTPHVRPAPFGAPHAC